MKIALAGLALAALVACTPSIEDAPTIAGDAYCDRAAECGWISEAEVGDCADTTEDVFQSAWSSTACDEGLVGEQWGICMDTIDALDCDDTLLLGWGDINDECNARDLCE